MENKTELKHTPEPWVFNQEEMKIKGSGDYEGRTIIANVSPKMDFSRGMATQCANAARIVECVNALSGVEDPKKWVEEMKDLESNFNVKVGSIMIHNQTLEEQIAQLQADVVVQIRIRVNATLTVANGLLAVVVCVGKIRYKIKFV